MALLKLSDKYSPVRLEAACKRALSYTTSPNFKTVQTILAAGQDALPDEEQAHIALSSDYGFTRGSAYYGWRSALGSDPDGDDNADQDISNTHRNGDGNQ